MAPKLRITACWITLLYIAGCGDGGGGTVHTLPPSPAVSTSAAQVKFWNDATTNAVSRYNKANPPGLPPFAEARLYAMAFIAVHDSLNAFERRYRPYVSDQSLGEGVAHVAMAAAVKRIFQAQLPGAVQYLQENYDYTMEIVADSDRKANSIALGERAADAINTLRAADGSATAMAPYVPGNRPGDYQFTPPFDGPPFNGFADSPRWGMVKPFAMESVERYRAYPTYKLDDPAYVADLAYVTAVGGATSTVRTADQSEIAKFWLESSALGWNRIAITIGEQRGLDAWQLARLAALVQIAVADSYIASLDSKYLYNFWRPITAIRMADSDGVDATHGDPAWVPFDPVTPPVPEYPSAHASAGGAAQMVLVRFFGIDKRITFAHTSTSLPGIVRSYDGLYQAARENADSRVFIGYHFPASVAVGLEQGQLVGSRVFESQLLPVN
ncbi:MAG TPA: vanadium-dependent haloperoxidase [Usitatibacter sp.]|nr:vanadium-dependent haloperoxidase [Usitatibacter sp.]